jgi:hypothetical protein
MAATAAAVSVAMTSAIPGPRHWARYARARLSEATLAPFMIVSGCWATNFLMAAV